MTMRSPILISILNWNGLDDTLACLSMLGATTSHIWDGVVVDNGSTVDPTPILKSAFPFVECIRLAENTGFVGGQNYSMRLAIERGYEAVLLLNSDCEISAPTIASMLAMLRSDEKIAAVSPLIYCKEKRDRPQMVAAWLDWSKHRSERPSSPDAITPEGNPPMVPGTALLLRSQALQKVGLLDPRYFAYYEDNDLCARIANNGLKACYCRAAKAWHSSRRVDEYSELALYLSSRNAWLFWRTHTPVDQRRGLFRHLLAQSLYEIAMLKKAGNDTKSAAIVAGFWDAQRGRFGQPPRQWCSPFLLRAAMCAAPYLAFDLLAHPVKAVRSRLKRRS